MSGEFIIPRRLECPICKSNEQLLGYPIAAPGLVWYKANATRDLFEEDNGGWLIDGKISYPRTAGLFCACVDCHIYGPEALFDPKKKPPRMYRDRRGFYIKLTLPSKIGEGLYSRIELKCYLREDNQAGLECIGILKVASIRKAAQLPKYLTCGVEAIMQYAKAKLKELNKRKEKIVQSK